MSIEIHVDEALLRRKQCLTRFSPTWNNVCFLPVTATYETIETESFPNKLRSIVGQMEYAYEIRKWCELRVPFRTHLYVPEKHPVTQRDFHEHEDEGHVFKVGCFVCSFTLRQALFIAHQEMVVPFASDWKGLLKQHSTLKQI